METFVRNSNIIKYGITDHNFVNITDNNFDVEDIFNDHEIIKILLEKYEALMLSCEAKVYFNNIPKYIKKLTINFDIYDDININNLHYILEENGGSFNKRIDNLPNTLIKLCIISTEFNQPIHNLPEGLKELVILNESFNQSLDNLPNTLEYLVIHKYMTIEKIFINIDESYLMNLPRSLKTLHLKNNIIDDTQKKNLQDYYLGKNHKLDIILSEKYVI